MTNEQVLEIVKEKRTLIDVIRSRKKKWIGHVLRGNGLLKEIIEGRIVGKRDYAEMKEIARDRDNCRGLKCLELLSVTSAVA